MVRLLDWIEQGAVAQNKYGAPTLSVVEDAVNDWHEMYGNAW
jgi:hypothetical protein